MADDSYTEVTTKSWGNRLSGSIKGIVPGLILIVIGVSLLWWNEGRAVKRERALNEGQGQVVSVASATVDAQNDGRLIHTTGLATTNETLTDTDFGLSAQAIKLRRNVEMYQWKENSKSKTEEKLGGGTETTTTYTYVKGWDKQLIDSTNFKKTKGHQNPAEMPYKANTKQAGNVTLGAYALSENLISQISRYSDITLNKENIQLPEEIAHLNAAYIYIGKDPSKPKIGDMKISFQAVNPLQISLVSVQQGNSFTPFIASNGKLVELLEYGTKPAQLMFVNAHDSNETLTWILRVVGFFLLFTGIKMLLGLLPMLAAVIPQLGHLVGAATGIIAFLLSLIIALPTIALAWLFYRPIVAIVLLGIGGAAGYMGWKKLGENKQVETAT